MSLTGMDEVGNTKPISDGAVQSSFNALQDKVNELDNLVGTYIHSVDRVSRPEEDNIPGTIPDTIPEPEISVCALSNDLNNVSRQLEFICGRLGNAIDRVEL